MANLLDILKERTQEIYGLKKSTEEVINRKKQERKGKDQERKQIYTEIARKKEEIRTIKDGKKSKDNEIDAYQHKLDELEQKRMELLDLIFDLQHEQEEMDRKKTSLEDGIKEDEGDLRKLEGEIRALDREIESLMQKRNRLEEKWNDEARHSMEEYGKDLERQLVKMMEIAPETEQAMDAYRALMKAIEEDSEIRAKWEAREEWKRIYDISKVQAVKETARTEIEKKSKEIEEAFPGSLSMEKIEENESIILELYFFEEEEGYLVVFLPVTSETWKSISEGETGRREELAARVFWSFACGDKASYDLRHEFPALILPDTPDNISLSIEFPNEKKAEFSLEKLPDSILEAITGVNKA